MNSRKRAAIDLDVIKNKQLSEITAADFLAALDAGGLSARDLIIWPEKKKAELWVEPENFSRVRVGPVIEVILNEKKKAELEPLPSLQTGDTLHQLEDVLDGLTRRLDSIEAKLAQSK